MKKVAIVTDSTATIPPALLKELDIHMIPLILNVDGSSYKDGIDITPDAFYQLMRSSQSLPTTSSPSMGDFVRVYAAAGREAAGIVSIHLPANLSAIYMTALKASQLVDGPPIYVLDSRTVSMAQGFAVVEAARKAASGASLKEVVAHARAIAKQGRIYVMLETLEYLHRGGRIGDAASLLGGILHIKPVVYVLDGQVKPLSKPRTREKGREQMMKEMEKQAKGRPIHAAIVQADALEEAEAFKRQVEKHFACKELYITEFTPVMGAHAGPGILGIAFYVEPEDALNPSGEPGGIYKANADINSTA